MAKVELRYIGKHLPREVVEVDEQLADDLIARGDYVLASEQIRSNNTDDRVAKFAGDLADDGKHNYSNDDTKGKPGRKTK